MKKFPWRAMLYGAMLLYLVVDLKFCRGPLRQAMTSRRDASVEAAARNQWVAIINLEPVTREQLDLAVARHLHQRGKRPDDIPEKNLAMIKRAVLQTVIDDTLVRQYADGEKFVAPPAEIAAFVESWKSQFTTPEQIAERADDQGLTDEAIASELARIWSRKRWIEKRIAPAVTVTEEEAKAWFEANRGNAESGIRGGFIEPEKVRARQIFLSTVEVDDATREDLIREIHRKLTSGEAGFEALAKAHSEDERTKEKGGDLNWFSRNRLPEDFTGPVFALEPGKVSEPFKTRLGWHIAEVLERQAERPVTYEEIAVEIRQHLESERTEATVKELMGKLRKVANLQLFPENI
jgi:parvulin-like peptidyl-prolyl isomerase